MDVDGGRPADPLITIDAAAASGIASGLPDGLRIIWEVAAANGGDTVNVPLSIAVETATQMPDTDLRVALLDAIGASPHLTGPRWLWPGMPVMVRTIIFDGTTTRPGRVVAADPDAGTVTVEAWWEKPSGERHSFTTHTFSQDSGGKWMVDLTDPQRPEYVHRTYLHPIHSLVAASYRADIARDRLREALQNAETAAYGPAPAMDEAFAAATAAMDAMREAAAQKEAAPNV